MPQSFERILLHVVFSTKEHQPFLKDSDLRKRLYAYIAGIWKNMDSFAEIIGGTEDHIHILAAISRKHSVAELMREVKSHSTLWVKKNSEIRDFGWQRGYGAFSVSVSKADDVRKYISGQEEHHRKTTFKEEFRKLLERHGIDFDEKYMWD